MLVLGNSRRTHQQLFNYALEDECISSIDNR